MPNNELEVFDYLCSDGDTKLEIDYLAYAIFADKRFHWTMKYKELHGRVPNQAQIDEWVSELSDHDFSSMRTEAADFFHTAAADYMASEIAEARVSGQQSAISTSVSSIIREVRAIGRWRTQLTTALVTAMLVPFILGGAILCLKAFEDYMPTPFRIGGTHVITTNPPTAPPPTTVPPASPAGR